jgi:hypothetical protein
MSYTSPEFQIMTGLFFGLIVGLLSWGFMWTFFYIVAFEFLTFMWSWYYPPGDKTETRILTNAVFVFGWVMSHFLFYRTNGCETELAFSSTLNE